MEAADFLAQKFIRDVSVALEEYLSDLVFLQEKEGDKVKVIPDDTVQALAQLTNPINGQPVSISLSFENIARLV